MSTCTIRVTSSNGAKILDAIPIYVLIYNTFLYLFIGEFSAGFTYRLDRLKPRASKFKGSPTKVGVSLLMYFHTFAVITYCTF